MLGKNKTYSVTEARELFIHYRYAMVKTGIDILEVDYVYAKCVLVPNENHKNARGTVMGGALFTLADFTFAVAANYNKPIDTVTNTSQICFLRGASDGAIYAKSRIIKDGKTCCTYQIDIENSKGDLIALVTINGIHMNV